MNPFQNKTTDQDIPMREYIYIKDCEQQMIDFGSLATKISFILIGLSIYHRENEQFCRTI